MKKFLIILLSIVLVGSLGFIGYQQHTKKEKQEELARNRKYEISLVKALKNSYRDIKEIKIENPRYHKHKAGGWACTPTLVFLDGFEVTFNISHEIGDRRNRGGTIIGKEKDVSVKWQKVREYNGETKETVTGYYSNGEKGEQ